MKTVGWKQNLNKGGAVDMGNSWILQLASLTPSGWLESAHTSVQSKESEFQEVY